MPSFDWNEEKNQELKKERHVSFEMIIIAIKEGGLRAIEQPKKEQYKHQRYYIVELNQYVYIVPFVFNAEKNSYFLKTIYPSRKATKKYRKE